MDSQTQQKIEETVLEILNDADMQKTTEFKVRSMASEKLGLDLSTPERKRFVRHVVENFLQSKKEDETNQNQDQDRNQEEDAEKEEEEEEEGKKKKTGEKEYDDEGDLIICRLSNKRRVTLQEFRGKTLLSIREYYEKDGKQLPSSKDIENQLSQGPFDDVILPGNKMSIRAEFCLNWIKFHLLREGISLTTEQWEAFSSAVPKIEEAIKKLQGEGD